MGQARPTSNPRPSSTTRATLNAQTGHARADDVTDATASPPRAIFSSASEIDETAVAQPQAALRKRILRAFVGRGLLQSFEAKKMLGLAVGF